MPNESGTNRRDLLKMFGLGTAALILPAKELVIPAEAAEQQDREQYDGPVFITGDGITIQNCTIYGNLSLAGQHIAVHHCYFKYVTNAGIVADVNHAHFFNSTIEGPTDQPWLTKGDLLRGDPRGPVWSWDADSGVTFSP